MEEIPSIIHQSWHQHLQPLFNDKKMILLKTQILPQKPFYPNGRDIFKVFAMPFEDIKVVILGQDPYPNGEATGLAFAVNMKTPVPPSLKVIRREIDLSIYNDKPVYDMTSWKTLEGWRKQGVFLLNTALTVEKKKAGSHAGYWMWFTREVIKIISKKTAVWLLWGSKAQGFRDYIEYNTVMDEDLIEVMTPTNGVLLAPHPAAELYDREKSVKFSGCNHFKLANQILLSKNQTPVNW